MHFFPDMSEFGLALIALLLVALIIVTKTVPVLSHKLTGLDLIGTEMAD